MNDVGFKAGIQRELRQFTSRRIYFFGCIIVPILIVLFFLSLLHDGLPERVPTAIVDYDHSSISRSISRSLDALQLIEINNDAENYEDALEMIRRGEIFGFFVIPANFEKDAIAGNKPSLEYYTNMTYFIPGTLSFKGFKTVAVATAGGVVKETLQSMGFETNAIAATIQPVNININALGNPWLNYNYYLTPSFSFATLALMIMLMTVFSITTEIKNSTSQEWLRTSGGSIKMALLTKLLPQTIIFSAMAIFILSLLIGYSHFPCNGSIWAIIAALFLLVIASQAFAVFICCLLPNPRLALSVCSLFGILSFSFTGFSFPVENMYGALAIFSYIAPIRYWLLIYFNEALNGYDLYYSRMYFVALIIFPAIGCLLLKRLKKACLNPVYIP